MLYNPRDKFNDQEAPEFIFEEEKVTLIWSKNTPKEKIDTTRTKLSLAITNLQDDGHNISDLEEDEDKNTFTILGKDILELFRRNFHNFFSPHLIQDIVSNEKVIRALEGNLRKRVKFGTLFRKPKETSDTEGYSSKKRHS